MGGLLGKGAGCREWKGGGGGRDTLPKAAGCGGGAEFWCEWFAWGAVEGWCAAEVHDDVGRLRAAEPWHPLACDGERLHGLTAEPVNTRHPDWVDRDAVLWERAAWFRA